MVNTVIMSRKKCHHTVHLILLLICLHEITAESVSVNQSETSITTSASQPPVNTSTLSPTTTDSTTSVSSTTTTTTTPQTTTDITRLQLATFSLTNVSYSNSRISVDYAIKADYNLKINIEVNCRSRDYDQSWSSLVTTNLYLNNSTSGRVLMLPANQTAAPGSLIECQATALSSQGSVFIENNNSSIARVLTDPPSVYDLVATSLNETAIDLAWSVPAPNMGSFNSLEVKCFLNDDFTGVTTQNTLNKTIDDRTVDKLTVTNLIPGALYNCFVTTLRSVQDLATRKDSSIAACMTKLGQPVLENSLRLGQDNSIHFKLKPPPGFYDFFKVQLNIPLSTPGRQSRLLREISAENFTYTLSPSAPTDRKSVV